MALCLSRCTYSSQSTAMRRLISWVGRPTAVRISSMVTRPALGMLAAPTLANVAVILWRKEQKRRFFFSDMGKEEGGQWRSERVRRKTGMGIFQDQIIGGGKGEREKNKKRRMEWDKPDGEIVNDFIAVQRMRTALYLLFIYLFLFFFSIIWQWLRQRQRVVMMWWISPWNVIIGFRLVSVDESIFLKSYLITIFVLRAEKREK